MRKHKLEKSRWLCVQAEFEKKCADLTGTYAVAYLTDEELDELFFLIDKNIKRFIARRARVK